MSLPDFLNESFLLTMTGLFMGCFSGLLVYCLKSRCRRIECCCLKLERDTIPSNELNSINLGNINNNNNNNNV